jgi:mannose-6-phosphate isomerase-like protein (cupin superfamily)
MEVIKCLEEPGETISAPYQRHIKVMLAPDRRNCNEITYSHAILYPHSKTDYHKHDRPELIQILTGYGVFICDGEEIPVESDMALWVRPGEIHQMINRSDESMKLATVFVPAYTAQELLGSIWKAAERDQQEAAEM